MIGKLSRSFALFLFTGVFLATALLGSNQSFGQDYKVGDKVQFERFGRNYEGEVTRVAGSVLTIKYKDGPKTESVIKPTTRVKKIGGAPATSGGSSSSGTPAASGGSSSNSTSASSDTMRFWTDKSGKFKVKAKLSERVGDQVRLETEDGRLLTVPVAKLSEFDQEFLKTAGNAEGNPFAGGEMIKKGDGASSSENSGSSTGSGNGMVLNTVTPDLNAGKKVFLISNGDWNVYPDPELISESFTPQPVAHGDGGFEKPFFDKPGNFIISPDERVAAVSITNAFGGDRTAVQFFDLEKGKQLSSVAVPIKEASLVGVIMDPPTFATTRKEWFKDKGRVDFWDGSDGLKHIIGWEGKYKSARLVNDKQLLTIDDNGQAVVWDWRNAKAQYYFDAVAHAIPAVSANQKLMAVVVKTGIMILEVSSGKSLGTLQTSDRVTMMAFSRDGSKLSTIQNGNLAIWDLSSGEVVDQYALNGISPHNPKMVWADDEHILINGTALVNYRLRVPVWTYTGASMPLSGGRAGRFWYSVKTNGGGVIIPVNVPHQDVVQVGSQYDPEDFLVIKPGMKIAVKMNLPFPQKDQQKIYDNLVSKLTTNGIEVDPSSSTVLNCFTEKGKTQTREYQNRGGFGRPFGGGGTQKVTFTPTICYMQIANGSDVLWKRAVSSGPGFMMFLQDGQTAQQAANKQSKPSPSFYLSAQIPKIYAQLPGGKSSLGTSQLTENGMK